MRAAIIAAVDRVDSDRSTAEGAAGGQGSGDEDEAGLRGSARAPVPKVRHVPLQITVLHAVVTYRMYPEVTEYSTYTVRFDRYSNTSDLA